MNCSGIRNAQVIDQKWYQDFVADDNVDGDMVFDMLTAANFMGIKPLLDLTCLKVTFQLTGKSAEEVSVLAVSGIFCRNYYFLNMANYCMKRSRECLVQIRQILKLPELTPEEEAKAREDHKWIFEDT